MIQPLHTLVIKKNVVKGILLLKPLVLNQAAAASLGALKKL
jgi:hypothetical protein